MSDEVNQPPHYKTGGIETIDVLQAKLSPQEFAGFCIGNALKYLTRRHYKGKPEQDLAKAHWYLSRALKLQPAEPRDIIEEVLSQPVGLQAAYLEERFSPHGTDADGQPNPPAPGPPMACIQPGCTNDQREGRLYCEQHRLSSGKSGEYGGPDGK